MYRYFFALIICLNSCAEKKTDNSFYMPAEYEPQEAVWFGWEKFDTGFHPVIANVINAIRQGVQIKIAVSSDSLLLVCKQKLNALNVDTNGIHFYTMPGERYWIRDHGAAFLVNNKGELSVADFNWSMYGLMGWYLDMYDGNKDSAKLRYEKYFNKETGQVDSLMAVAEKASIIKSDLVIEGGAIEVNGKGTLILCEAVTFQRNPGKTKAELEEGFKKALGATHIIWMKQGLIDDSHIQQLHFGKYATMGTGGHTDEFIRFINDTSVLLAWVDEAETGKHPFHQINHERMSENLRRLEAATDQDGRKLRIIKVPLPDLIMRKVIVKAELDSNDQINVKPSYFIKRHRPAIGDTLLQVSASSYLNYLVTNDAVVLPTYIKHGSSQVKEQQVEEIFKEAFPKRKLAWVDCLPQNWNGGGIHCSTQQQPKRKK
ncbi:MAG: agmatine deiminase family protein [Chitinophagaceae bacterium]|jgi:agmatine deiminase|nr:agmatine deiminase family protein [Chitinophagaceae bacterium]